MVINTSVIRSLKAFGEIVVFDRGLSSCNVLNCLELTVIRVSGYSMTVVEKLLVMNGRMGM